MSSWFEEIFCFKEGRGAEGYRHTQEAFTYDPSSGRLCSQGLPCCDFAAGIFRTPALEELRERNDLDQARTDLGGRRLTVREVVADVSELHILEENRYALFQAASQFNALEHVSPDGLPEHGITCYTGDHTQGPACATACAPGTVVRNYFAFGSEGQTHTRQVENLADVEELLDNKRHCYFHVHAGYTMAGHGLDKLSAALDADASLCEGIRRKLRVGVQEDTEVVCSNFGDKLYRGPPRSQLVTQVYCSAISVAYSGMDPQLWERFARLILESLYEATLYTALENFRRHPKEPGARKVFLTAVGGGVFGNDMSWIQEAMHKAFRKFKHVGLEVFLVSYGRPCPVFQGLLTYGASPGAVLSCLGAFAKDLCTLSITGRRRA
mmetsp:Transcript_87803/g.221557  ORF Transcript_87803/g.221557 Transcript_87803/m.221557 type:complete len:381 (-) Transcript_87803:21-1163(-)